MPKRFIQKYTPDHQTLREHKHLRFFGDLLLDHNLWHLNRRSFAGAFALGLFIAFIPLPTQMIFAAAAAIFFKVNLPVSVATVWVTNPLTMPPIFYGSYVLGAYLMNIPPDSVTFELSVDGVMKNLGQIWQPFLLGCFVAGSIASAIGYGLARSLWRWFMVKKWRSRQR